MYPTLLNRSEISLKTCTPFHTCAGKHTEGIQNMNYTKHKIWFIVHYISKGDSHCPGEVGGPERR